MKAFLLLPVLCVFSGCGLAGDLGVGNSSNPPASATPQYVITPTTNYAWNVTRPAQETSDCIVTNATANGALIFAATSVSIDAFYDTGIHVPYTGNCAQTVSIPDLQAGNAYMIVTRMTGSLITNGMQQTCTFYAHDINVTLTAGQTFTSNKLLAGGCGPQY
jgi:hypothetical protein